MTGAKTRADTRLPHVNIVEWGNESRGQENGLQVTARKPATI